MNMTSLADNDVSILSRSILASEAKELAKSINGYKFSLSNIEMNALLAGNAEIRSTCKELINKCNGLLSGLYECASLISDFYTRNYITNYDYSCVDDMINDIKNKRDQILPKIRELELRII